MIVSLLAGSQAHPVGGVTTRYALANALSRRGHEVHLVHFSWFRPCVTSLAELSWFRFAAGVQHHFAPTGETLVLPDADFISDHRFPRRHGLPFTFFQGTEPFGPQMLESVFEAPGPKICVARWLVERARARGIEDHRLLHLPNGIDHDKYRVITPLDARPSQVAMLHHPAEIKGARFGLRALEDTKREHPGMTVVLFGTRAPKEAVPPWMEFRRNPAQDALVREVYNGSRIFVCPSLYPEGFGKASVEAMACGCALVTTANGGSDDFAFPGETALVSEPEDVATMAAHLDALLRDDERRQAIARRGADFVRGFDWDRNAAVLEEYLERYRADPAAFLGETG